MCQDLPSCEFLPTKNRRAPIVADKAEQSRYFYESTELSTLQERTGIKVNRSKVSAALSLCLLATLGATQAVLAQGGAHIADNSGAESSHVIFVPLPPEVSRAEVQHADAVLKDKLYHHVQNWLSSQEPTPGVNNQTDLVIILTDQDGTPILPDVEAARSRFNLAEAPSVQATANELTFTFNSSDYPWTATEIADLQTQLGDYYPTAKA